MNVLSELGEFVKSVVEIAKTAPPDKLAIAIAGAVALGAVPAYFVGRAMGKRGRPTGPTPPLPGPDEDLLATAKRLLIALDKPDDELWRFHQAPLPQGGLDAIRASGLKVLTFANLKGGVGKTTMTANIAAYLEECGFRVLLIDFDYQGSLTSAARRAAQYNEVHGSSADKILTGQLIGAELADARFSLQPRLPGMSLIPAGNELNRQDTRMFVHWLLKPKDGDPRYALARALADPAVHQRFDVVLIDTPPRLTLSTINALAASTHYCVPTILDFASIENIGNFVRQTDQLFRKGLNPRLEFAGIIGTMTEKLQLKDVELQARKRALDMALEEWGPNAYIFNQNVPDTARFREDAGRDIAYLDTRATNEATRSVIEAIGAEFVERLSLKVKA